MKTPAQTVKECKPLPSNYEMTIAEIQSIAEDAKTQDAGETLYNAITMAYRFGFIKGSRATRRGKY